MTAAFVDSIVKQQAAVNRFARRGLEKAAADPSDAGDISFEQALSNLAHSYMREKAPGLLDYEIGFQLVDKNEDNTKAFGVFGFKVGNQWLYGPIVFDNGALKGHELIYVKNQNIFVPNEEKWLNYLLNRKPHVLGKSVHRDLARLGVLPPNFYQIVRTPAKYASAEFGNQPEWVCDFLPAFAKAVRTNPLNCSNLPDLPSFLKEAGVEACRGLIRMLHDYPGIWEGIEKFYGAEKIAETMKEVRQGADEAKNVLRKVHQALEPNESEEERRREEELSFKSRSGGTASKSILPASAEVNAEPGDPIKTGALRIIHIRRMSLRGISPAGESVLGKEEIKPAEKEKLLRGEVVIRDYREENQISRAYEIDETKKLLNPGESGLYDVLVQPAEFARCAVFIGPYTNKGRSGGALVVRLDNGTWVSAHPSSIWVKPDNTLAEFRSWVDSLPDADNAANDGKHVIISRSGSQATLPMQISRYRSDDGSKTFEVYFDTGTKKERPGSLIHHSPRGELGHVSPFERYSPFEIEPLSWNRNDYGPCYVTFTGRPGKGFYASGDALYVPNTAKSFKLFDGSCGCGADSEPPPMLLLDSTPSFYLGIHKMAGELLTIRHSGSQVAIGNGADQDEDSALVELVAEHGLKESAARELISRAAKNRSISVNVKYAQPYFDLQQSGPSAPPMPEPPMAFDPMTNAMLPTWTSIEQQQPIPGLQSQLTDRMVYHPLYGGMGPENMRIGPEPDSQAAQTAMEAGQTGQKEVFDTAMIGSLLKATKSDSVVNKNVGKMMTGLDAVGRTMLSLFWNKEDYKDRYGKEDADAIEEGLKTTFSDLGDLILSLRQGDPRHVTGEDSTHPDLDRTKED